VSSFPRSVADELGRRDSSICAAHPIAIGLVGVGKIAKEQHLPALATNPAFQLAATACRHGRVDGLVSGSGPPAVSRRRVSVRSADRG